MAAGLEVDLIFGIELMNHAKWIESGGGPLLLAHESSRTGWLGSQGPHEFTDYARACEISEEIGLIDVKGWQAVVVGDEPDRTALVQISSSAFLIVRWRWAQSEESLLFALFQPSGLEAIPFSPRLVFAVHQGTYFLFDSACHGEKVTQSLNIELQSGDYCIETGLFAPQKEISALIHRISLRG